MVYTNLYECSVFSKPKNALFILVLVKTVLTNDKVLQKIRKDSTS